MKKGGGKAKGSAFERYLAKRFSKWIQGTEKPYLLWKSPNSGGVSSVILENVDMSGDIIALKEEAKFLTDIFSIEAKNGYPKASLDKHLKYNKNDEIESFWNQAKSDASRGNKSPLLIIKRKGLNTIWLGINNNIYNKLQIKLEDIRFIHLRYKKNDEIYFFEIEEFLEKISPNDIKDLKNEN